MPVLAQYTIRSKQKYIFKTNRLTEITGASVKIATAFSVLFDAAEKDAGLRIARCSEKPESFSLQDTLERFQSGSLQMTELFIGGGNATVLYDNRDSFVKANRAFTRRLLNESPGMIPMCVGVEVGRNGYCYREDYQRLMDACDAEKNHMSVITSVYPVPFAMLDRDVLQPYTSREQIGPREWTAEALSKVREAEVNEGQFLDDLITKKDEESLLAIVHADGNNMGQKIIRLLNGHENSYDECVTLMRRMTRDTANVFSVLGRNAVNQKAAELKQKRDTGINKKTAFEVRWIIAEGDDILFICNARIARELTCAYLNAVSQAQPGSVIGSYSSCAGICIFHSHYPWAYAYSFAEDACSAAKKHVHLTRQEESWFDFHFVHSGLQQDLSELRHWQDTERCIARPWRVDKDDDLYSVSKLDQLAGFLKEKQVARSNIKAIGKSMENGETFALQELQRIYYRVPGLKAKLTELFANETNALKAIYDLSEVYDLWYSGRASI